MSNLSIFNERLTTRVTCMMGNAFPRICSRFVALFNWWDLKLVRFVSWGTRKLRRPALQLVSRAIGQVVTYYQQLTSKPPSVCSCRSHCLVAGEPNAISSWEQLSLNCGFVDSNENRERERKKTLTITKYSIRIRRQLRRLVGGIGGT